MVMYVNDMVILLFLKSFSRNYPNGVGGCLNHSVDLSRRLSQSYMSWMDFLMIMTLTNRIQKLLKKMNHGMIVLIPNLLRLVYKVLIDMHANKNQTKDTFLS